MKKGERGEINKIKKFLNKEEKDKRGMENLEERTGQRKISRSGGFLARAFSGIYAIVLAASLWGCGPYQKAQTEEAIFLPTETRSAVTEYAKSPYKVEQWGRDYLFTGECYWTNYLGNKQIFARTGTKIDIGKIIEKKTKNGKKYNNNKN